MANNNSNNLFLKLVRFFVFVRVLNVGLVRFEMSMTYVIIKERIV